MASAKLPRGYVLYEGPSELNPAINIIVVAVMGSGNSKTGDAVQVYYLVADTDPQTASKLKLDEAICGDCVHRQCNGGACYVLLFHGPRIVYDGYQRGIYSYDTEEFYERIGSRVVRLGAYGDPGSVPTALTAKITEAAAGWTGYTHQSEREGFDRELLQHVMQSTDSPAEYHAKDGRSFRVRGAGEPLLEGEIECPHERVSCVDCKLCKGGNVGANISIEVHGSRSGRFKVADSVAQGADIIAAVA